MDNLIQPRILKGFRDFLPEAEILRTSLTEEITKVYRSFGFVPIDTPVLEYSEILLRKSNGETEKQVFRFEDNGHRDVGMRFDLTVPFARFTAAHKNELYFPFKRYHIAKVWRGEKPQAGRYREFVQCDVDTVGSDSACADFEILHAMKNALESIGVSNIRILVNHRGIFNVFLKKLELTEKNEEILRVVDKIKKVSESEIRDELKKIILEIFSDISEVELKVQKIWDFVTNCGDFEQVLDRMSDFAGKEAAVYINRMKTIYQMMQSAGIDSVFTLDPSITRGLDYYTGVVFETFVIGKENFGSVCSGGRYDNLAGLYTKDKISGVGGSIGIDRLIAVLEDLNLLDKRGSYLDAEIFCQNDNDIIHYQKAACKLREAGVAVEVFPEAKKMIKQYDLAAAKGVRWGILIGNEEISEGSVSLKNLESREVFLKIDIEQAVKIIKNSNRK